MSGTVARCSKRPCSHLAPRTVLVKSAYAECLELGYKHRSDLLLVKLYSCHGIMCLTSYICTTVLLESQWRCYV